MKAELIAFAALFLAGCAPGPGPLPSPTPAAAPDRLDEIARGVRENKRWASPEDRKNDLETLAKGGRAEHLDALLRIVEKEDSALSLLALRTAAPLLDPPKLALVEPLVASDDDTICMRGLFLLSLARLPEAAAILTPRLPKILSADRPKVAGVALGALAASKATAATRQIADYFTATENGVALRSLGTIWNRTLNAPALPNDQEGLRLYALLHTYSLTMSAAATADSTLAMLRIMTAAELDKLLTEATEKFSSRALVTGVAGLADLDPAKGLKIHAAFLKSPDPEILASILWTSPHPLDAKSVAPLLADDRDAMEARVCDYAAQRLAAIVDKSPMELPKKKDRDGVVKKWRDRMK